MSPLVCTNVVKRYRQGDRSVDALRGISLDIVQGRFVAIMGASGSGKSTLLHLMAGLTRADEGRVLVNGQDLAVLKDKPLTLFRRRQIGLIFQSFNLIPTLTAAENVRLPLMLDGINGRATDEKVAMTLDRLGLASRSHHRPDALSGGEQQRVAIGRAIIADPAVILADEPTGNLDSENSDAVCELLRNLSNQQGKTIVMVTHEPNVAAFAHEVVVIKDGQLVERFDTGNLSAIELATRYQRAARG
jgi:putative ABC transport system ATP-binding protein